MTLLTWSNLESVRENFGYPADGTVSAILFITGISWQKCLGAHQARMQGLLQPSWRQRDFNFVFFFSIFYAPTTTDNRWKLLFCHMWLWETGQKDLMVPFEVHYRSKWCSFPTTLTKRSKRLAGRGVPPGCPNPEPISDQKMSFSTPVFRPDLKNQTWPLDRIYVIIP